MKNDYRNLNNLQTVEQVQQELATMESHMNQLITLRDNLSKQSPVERLAVHLYNQLGRTKDDSWFYEIKDGIHDWRGQCHALWHRRAAFAINASQQAYMDYQKKYGVQNPVEPNLYYSENLIKSIVNALNA